MRAGLLLAVFALSLVAVTPAAEADHVFSHRVYVVGRVIDEAGLPAPGLPVSLTFRNVNASGACIERSEDTTGPQGDFKICRHAHTLKEDAAVAITVGNRTVTADIDPVARHAWAHVQLEGPREARDISGDRLFDRTFRVVGRAFAPASEGTEVERVPVQGTPLAGSNVTIRLGIGVETLASAVAKVDEMGFFDADLDVEEIPEGARVRVEIGERQTATDASQPFRRADVVFVRTSIPVLGPDGTSGAPGSGEVAFPGAVAAVGALMLAAGAVGVGRRQARR